MSLPDPITRREQYLNIAAGGTGSLPSSPITREEQYLAAIAEGGGGGLPPVTSEDNGDVLGVVNGVWGKMAAPGGLPPVTSSDNGKVLAVEDGSWAAGNKAVPLTVSFSKYGSTVSCNASGADILAAAQAGRQVLGTGDANAIWGINSAFYGTVVLRLSGYKDSNLLCFEATVGFYPDGVANDEYYTVQIEGQAMLGTWAWTAHKRQIQPLLSSATGVSF